jgi:DNA primase
MSISPYPEAIRYLARKYNIEIEETELTQKKQIQIFEYVLGFRIRQRLFSSNALKSEEGKAIGLSYFKEGFN